MGDEEKKLTEEEFVLKSIKKHRGNYKAIHSVYSGFNQAFRKYFETDPIETTQRLAKEGKIFVRPVKGGVLIYLPEDVPNNPDEFIRKTLEDDE